MTKSESGFPMTLWSMEYWKKCLKLVAVFADHMEHDDEVNLGATETHFLEHLFGEQQSLSHGDDS
jgi:hypothetical protein